MIGIRDAKCILVLVSIIIPVLNEARCIEQTLQSLQSQTPPFEIIVSDGGSSDDTVSVASSFATVISSPKGRASQMNAGARVAKGKILLFLHADTHLPKDGLSLVRESILSKGKEAGAFRLRFDQESFLLKFYSLCTRLNNPRLCFGDRSLFVRKDIFNAVGGFSPIPIFEDIELVRRLHRRGAFTFLPSYVTTAARRFEQNGLLSQQLLNSYLWLRYLLGASPHHLAHLYKYPPC